MPDPVKESKPSPQVSLRIVDDSVRGHDDVNDNEVDLGLLLLEGFHSGRYSLLRQHVEAGVLKVVHITIDIKRLIIYEQYQQAPP